MAHQQTSSMSVACDYLGALCEHAYKHLMESFPIDFLQRLHVEVILTAPDIISDQGKTNFYSVRPNRPIISEMLKYLQAAKFKGVDSIKLISVTDAAASYVDRSTDRMSSYWCEVSLYPRQLLAISEYKHRKEKSTPSVMLATKTVMFVPSKNRNLGI
jgi:hypothetical protein